MANERQGYGLIQTLQTFVLSASKADITGSANVSEYNNHVLQHVTTRSGSANATSSIIIRSSLDNANWQDDVVGSELLTSTSSLLTRISGRRGYIQVLLHNSGNITSSVYILSGQ